MLANYLKLAIRQTWGNRLFSLLNLLGLSLGLAACLLIVQFVRFEQSFDRQHPAAERIWRAYNQTVVDGAVVTEDANTHSALGPSLKNDLPGEVEDFARIYNRGEESTVFVKNGQPIRVQSAFLADPGFLRLFPQKVLAGDLATSLDAPFSLVLSRKAALQLFPDIESAIGQALKIPAELFNGTFVVRAVVEDPPANVHIHFNALGSYATRHAQGHSDNWDSYWEYNYFQLAPHADPGRVRQKLADYSEAYLKKEGIRLAMQPLADIHLHSALTYEIEANGSARSLRFLGLAAGLVLLIAFVNYVNLSTARSMKRGREVGVRKAVGASRGHLVVQFLVEGAVLNLASMGLALSLVQSAMPAFSAWLGRPLDTVPGYDAPFWAMVAGLWLLSVVGACFWPALALSGYSPLSVLRSGFFKRREKNNLRHGLVVFQFVCSTSLIVAVLTIREQLFFLKNHDKGLSLEQVVTVRMPATDWRLDSLNQPKMRVLKNEIAQVPGVRSVAGSSIVPSLGISSIAGTNAGVVQVRQPSASGQATTYFVSIEKGFLETYGIRMAAGEYYEAANEMAEGSAVLINDAARKMLGFASAEAAVGEEIAYRGNTDSRMRVHGVISDFHIESLKEPARPTLYFCKQTVRNGYLSLKIAAPNAAEVMAQVLPVWQRIWPESPMDWQFLDKNFDAQYRSEQQLGQVFGLFSGLALVVACLGLFGLAAFVAERRTKEIGIRKVLGASAAGIAQLLVGDFLKLVLVAIVIASPVAHYFMQAWLADFAHRIEVEWWMFAAAGAVAVAIAFLAVGFQSVKAALANPVKSLRSE
jgi:putative ABC transport system permease protein